MTDICVKPRINKKNNQINISLKRRNLPKKLVDRIDSVEELFFEIKGWH